jgi:hypothetical protein
MSGTLQVGGVTLATHTESPSKLTLDSGVVFPAEHIIQIAHTSKGDENSVYTTSSSHEIVHDAIWLLSLHLDLMLVLIHKPTLLEFQYMM